MAGVGETAIKEGMNHKPFWIIFATVVGVILLFVAYRLAKNNATGKPLFSNFLPEKTADKGIEGNKNIEADKIEKLSQGDNSPIITTGGSESPGTVGKDYKPDKRSTKVYGDRTSGNNSPIVKGNNNEVNSSKTYMGVKQRHVYNELIEEIMRVCQSKDRKILFLTPPQDQEAIAFADEIIDQLKKQGYTKIDKSWFSGGFTSPPKKEPFISFEPNIHPDTDGFYICPASNLQNQ